MKKLSLFIGLGLFTLTGLSFAQTTITTTKTTQTITVDQKRLEMAKEGCAKHIGFFPTPSKLMCLLAATGQTEKEANPKALAIVFATCKGQVAVPVAGTTQKVHESLGACLSHPQTVNQINKELAAKGFPPISIKNKEVLSVPATLLIKPATPTSKAQ